MHLFFECFYAKSLAKKKKLGKNLVEKMVDNSTKTTTNFDLRTWSLGISKNSMSDLINTVIFETKWHIQMIVHTETIVNTYSAEIQIKYQ